MCFLPLWLIPHPDRLWGLRYWTDPLLIGAVQEQAGESMQNRHPQCVNAYILLRRRVALETRRRYPSRSAEKIRICPREPLAREELFVWIMLLSGRNMQGRVWLAPPEVIGATVAIKSLEVWGCVMRVDGSNPLTIWDSTAKGWAKQKKKGFTFLLRCPRARHLHAKLHYRLSGSLRLMMCKLSNAKIKCFISSTGKIFKHSYNVISYFPYQDLEYSSTDQNGEKAKCIYEKFKRLLPPVFLDLCSETLL